MSEPTGAYVWPERPTCHHPVVVNRGEGFLVTYQKHYDGLRHCSYCGSLHPEDLLAVLDQDAQLGGSDWKYGYPHKFYLHGGPAPNAKFYTDHLQDQGYSDAALTALLAALSTHSGITWQRNAEGRIVYEAPHFGYQRSPERGATPGMERIRNAFRPGEHTVSEEGDPKEEV